MNASWRVPRIQADRTTGRVVIVMDTSLWAAIVAAASQGPAVAELAQLLKTEASPPAPPAPSGGRGRRGGLNLGLARITHRFEGSPEDQTGS